MSYPYVAHWHWTPDARVGHWDAPYRSFCVGRLDMRPNPSQGKAGGSPQGYGLFVFNRPISDPQLYPLNPNIREPIDAADRDYLRSILNIAEPIRSDKTVDVLWDIMTIHADPTGRDRVKSLMPKADLSMELLLGGYSKIKEKRLIPFQSPEWDTVLSTVQLSYAANRAKHYTLLARLMRRQDRHQHLKYLGWLVQKYGIQNYRIFIPPGLPDEAPLPPETTITEDFSGDLSNWTQVLGTWGIVTAHLEVTTAGGGGTSSIKHNTSLAGDDHYAEADMTLNVDTTGAHFGVAARYTDNDDHYKGGPTDNFTDDDEIKKRVSGTYTSLGTNARNWVDGETGRLKVDGSSLDFLVNGVSKVTATDTAHSGQLVIGITDEFGEPGNFEWDDFEAADLAGAAAHHRIGFGAGYARQE